jgi:hypothetical protein
LPGTPNTTAEITGNGAKRAVPHTSRSQRDLFAMLTSLVDPIIAAIARHRQRLTHLQEAGSPAAPFDLPAESAKICEQDIQGIVQPEYQQIAEAQSALRDKLRALADAQRDLARLITPRLRQVRGRPDDGEYTLFVQGSVDAARAVYGIVISGGPPVHPGDLASHLTSFGSMANAGASASPGVG